MRGVCVGEGGARGRGGGRGYEGSGVVITSILLIRLTT